MGPASRRSGRGCVDLKRVTRAVQIWTSERIVEADLAESQCVLLRS